MCYDGECEKALDSGEKIELLVDKIREPLFTGTRFQSARNENDKKDVVSEHED
ncbi:hypothetical protein ISN45_Aa03g027860 [Arabidopsis thaliana x Arabidopsis arenosa]|uniref:Uncharacterized protein n=1 Tax=Arabidopsis thaliana x Arabidopsis arenosa TaxID=1240361 RepID=A0A8T2AWM5_9BRAS|nr:hypothetical protein ISN45_Aa03g027860 [Arabidopsis thaliana x Arabidopsis arenosa]KAG7578614.1 hypothetical protein ISN45_Aa03g027860 [Arabidopsis thaliana x Arabidopsis arenosa]KAG7578615.1 hypothetical protein ISN45_Aa03g027860 [Arabidopsis thaliana x Arabidopsis arenosa]KAG7578616.1 hypothetical protein ISN45_Aa03g027860 [Arabidopsis thaliana x Arabidopsis arenosa]KAG7578617.1 hypothetical protein ISN45_Aa03g027860 [Arabidopsis thaliana x Arabidopsis arenosa]